MIPSMSKASCDIRIGTSGWHYDHWKGVFYPEGLPKGKWLEHYAGHFDTVEINNTFYHLPKEQSVQRWRDVAPHGFLYSVKANRYITHSSLAEDALLLSPLLICCDWKRQFVALSFERVFAGHCTFAGGYNENIHQVLDRNRSCNLSCQ